MDLNLSSCHLYAGRGAGRPIKKAIDQATSSIEVCSPYVSKNFVQRLVERHERDGLNVTLITSNDFIGRKYSGVIGRNLIKQVRHTSKTALVSRKRTYIWGWLFVLGALVALGGAWSMAGDNQLKLAIVAGLSGCAGMISLYWAKNTAIYSYSYTPRINMIVCNPYDERYNRDNYLIHTKAYVMDERTAFFGSCNFTYSGFSYNHEFRVDIEDQCEAKKVASEIKAMSHRLAYMAIPIEKLGRMFYSEPKY